MNIRCEPVLYHTTIFCFYQAVRTVERVGARIAEVSGLEGCKWEFLVVKDKTLNAFALPGGKVKGRQNVRYIIMDK